MEEFIGLEYGRLEIIEAPYRKGKYLYAVCKCKCGNTKEVPFYNVKYGKTKSCGCLAKETFQANKTKHGATGTKEYAVFKAMQDRCYNPNNKRYKDYGGRGIKVCDRWLEKKGQGFINFMEDMGPKPTPKHTLDRYPDNNGDYCPENTRWATYKEQNNNLRTNIVVTYKEETRTLSEWADLYNINLDLLRDRYIRKEMSFEEALTKEVGSSSKRLDSNTIISIYKDCGTLQDMRTKYGVNSTTINRIKDRSRHKDLTKDLGEPGEIITKYNYLSEEDIISIYTSKLSTKELSEIFSCRSNIINRIKSGKTYSEITKDL